MQSKKLLVHDLPVKDQLESLVESHQDGSQISPYTSAAATVRETQHTDPVTSAFHLSETRKTLLWVSVCMERMMAKHQVLL